MLERFPVYIDVESTVYVWQTPWERELRGTMLRTWPLPGVFSVFPPWPARRHWTGWFLAVLVILRIVVPALQNRFVKLTILFCSGNESHVAKYYFVIFTGIFVLNWNCLCWFNQKFVKLAMKLCKINKNMFLPVMNLIWQNLFLSLLQICYCSVFLCC